MLAVAREQFGGPAPDTEVILGDTQTHTFPPGSFDLLVSRIVRDVLRRFGRRLPQTARHVARRLGTPAEKQPHAPGPLAFSNAAHVRRILEEAGFAAVSVTRETCDLAGASPEEAVFKARRRLITEREPQEAMLNEIRRKLRRRSTSCTRALQS